MFCRNLNSLVRYFSWVLVIFFVWVLRKNSGKLEHTWEFFDFFVINSWVFFFVKNKSLCLVEHHCSRINGWSSILVNSMKRKKKNNFLLISGLNFTKLWKKTLLVNKFLWSFNLAEASRNRKKVDIDGFRLFETLKDAVLQREEEKMPQGHESKYDLRKSLAWDSAFFTSPGLCLCF